MPLENGVVCRGTLVYIGRNTQMGIDAAEIPRLFERYYRVNNNNTVSGFGIGLYLSAEIIERHQGKIWAESELSKGSTFYFSLPLSAE